MVVVSWIISLLLSLPQAFMFRKLKHPAVEFYQCTTDMVVEEYSDQVVVDGETRFIFLGVDSETIYSIYHFSFLFFVFFFPLACLIFNYGIVIKMIRRYFSPTHKQAIFQSYKSYIAVDSLSVKTLAKTSAESPRCYRRACGPT
jgi:hypothetical protein